jgi:DNA-binding protein
MKIDPYLNRVLSAVKQIYPKEYPQIAQFMEAYKAQIPKAISVAQINRALKVADVVMRNLETMKDDLLDEEEELEEMGIGETE